MGCCDAIVKYKYPKHKLILGTLNVEVAFDALDLEDKTALLVAIRKNLEDALANKDISAPARIAKKFFTIQKRTPLRLRTVVATDAAVREVLAEYIPKRPFVLLVDDVGFSVAFVREMKSGPAFIPVCHCEPCCDKKQKPSPTPSPKQKEESVVVVPSPAVPVVEEPVRQRDSDAQPAITPASDNVPVLDVDPTAPVPTTEEVKTEPVSDRSAETTEEGKKEGKEEGDKAEKKREEGQKLKEMTEEPPKLPYRALKPVATKYTK